MFTRRIVVGAAALTTASALALSVPSAGVGATAMAVAPYTATANAEVLHVEALGVPGMSPVADVGLGQTSGSVTATAAALPRTTAAARNLDAALLGTALPAILAEAEQSAPPDNPTPATDVSIPGVIPGLLTLAVSNATAQARTSSAPQSCLAVDQALSASRISTADVALLDVPSVGTLLELPGTLSTSQATALAASASSTPGARDVVTLAQGSAADLRLFDGQVQIRVASAPILGARATGRAGTADVKYAAPLVTVSVAGNAQTLPADGSPLNIVSPDNPLLRLELSLGQLTNRQVAADGTCASGRATLLHVKVALGVAPLALTVLDADLFPLSVAATAPAGGVTCPVTGPPPAPNDADGDGLTDGQETSGSENDGFGNQPTNPNDADSDDDGLTDGQETSGSENDGFGNQPTNPNDPDTDDGGVGDGVETGRGTNPNNPADDTTTPPPPPGPTDLDGDGLTNDEENDLGTDPRNPDTDGDGLTDGAEVKVHRTDPRDPDTDNDRLTDGREVRSTRTNPRDPDTDNDRLKDGREVIKLRTNPRRKDTDRDGLNDKQEVTGSANKRYDRCKTNPRRADTDRDLLKDGAEVKRHRTNPCNKDTDGAGIRDGVEVRAGSDPLDPNSTPRKP